MKRQWSLILAFLFALIVAIFAVINVDPVEVNYLFGTAQWPLILVIISSVLMGGFIVGAVGVFRYYSLSRKVRLLEKENNALKTKQVTPEVMDEEQEEELKEETKE
ncbi:LapA family protein [Litchfieldia alkalitelluris]|uniref:LapA family protein n=1 Tax=Litchfieldia alkalitelluris TaxID=304268 RepID=UPI00099716B4|nr:lipopolysaccharide assembly protein LapA domain-containing protein [Litchfieldia alkalitelluris]